VSGGGRPLEPEARAEMEAALGHDFGDVRVHTDAAAHELSRALDARALTAGRDIFFRNGAHDLRSSRGKDTLAHELIHVVQREKSAAPPGQAVSQPSDAAEQEATAAAAAFAAEPGVAPSIGAAPAAIIQRQATSAEAPATMPPPEETLMSGGELVEETRYNLTLSTGTFKELTEAEALNVLADVHYKTKFNVDILAGEHEIVKQSRDQDFFVGLGGAITDLVGDTMPPVKMWDEPKGALGAAAAALRARNIEGAVGSLGRADAAYQKCKDRWLSYKDQLGGAAFNAQVAIIAVAVVLAATAVVVFVAAPAAAAAGAGAAGEAAAAGGGAAAAGEAALATTVPAAEAGVAAAEAGAAAGEAAALGRTIAASEAAAEGMIATAEAAAAADAAAANVIEQVGIAIIEGGYEAGLAEAQALASTPEGLALVQRATVIAATTFWTGEEAALLTQITTALGNAYIFSPLPGMPGLVGLP